MFPTPDREVPDVNDFETMNQELTKLMPQEMANAVNLFAHPLMQIFVKASEMEVIAIGVQYLRLEGSFYLGIGWLFLLYGYYRAVKHAEMSVVLTVISLGMRVALAYLFSATALGVAGIWIAIPIGWALADMTGLFFLRRAFRSQKPA